MNDGIGKFLNICKLFKEDNVDAKNEQKQRKEESEPANYGYQPTADMLHCVQGGITMVVASQDTLVIH